MILRDYQNDLARKAVQLLEQFKIVYLAMQTRTGKTLTALTAANDYKAKNVLFVTKKKAIPSIQKDYNAGCFEFDITVINYESVHKVEGQFDLIICDEAHALGQFPKPNNRCKAMKKIAIYKPIIYLSATPSPESYSQLFHQLWISSYSPLNRYITFYKFAYDFVSIKKKYVYNRELNDYSDCNREKLWANIKHLFLTYTQKDAGFTVEINEKILIVPMPNNLLEIIRTINKESVYISEELEIVADTAVKVMQKVHQLSSGTVIDENGYNIVSDYKAQFLKKQFSAQKLAIFYKFKSELEMLKGVFENSTDVAEDFQSGKYNVFVGQFVSAREGIRLDQADAIIFFNIDFSFLSYEQARNRIASFERKQTAILYWVFSDNGIEKRIYKAVKNKEDYTLAHYRYDRRQI
jgi:hypothetical protein